MELADPAAQLTGRASEVHRGRLPPVKVSLGSLDWNQLERSAGSGPQ